MHLALIALLATSPFPPFPPCSPEQALDPNLAAIGQAFDAERSFGSPITSDIVASLGGVTECGVSMSGAEINETDIALHRGSCFGSIVVSGRPVTRRFLLTPAKRYVFTEYEFTVDHVYRGAGVTAGTTIKIIRGGGVVCGTNGTTYRALHFNQGLLEAGQRYMLFLKPNNGRYLSSSWDWSLGDTTSSLAESEPTPRLTIESSALVSRVSTEPTCEQ